METLFSHHKTQTLILLRLDSETNGGRRRDRVSVHHAEQQFLQCDAYFERILFLAFPQLHEEATRDPDP